MRVLPFVQQLVEAAQTTIVFDESRCLYDLDRFSDCQACFSVCPAGAIDTKKPPALDIDACQFCRACLPVCPVGAYTYTGIDAAQALTDCARLMKVRTFELFCQQNPKVDRGDPEIEAAICVRGCLAGLGASAYLTLVGQGAEKVLARTDYCQGCPWQALQPRVEAQIKQAQALLKLWGRESALVNVDWVNDDEATSRPVWHAQSPPRSRRDLVKLAMKDPEDNHDKDMASGRFRERLRVLRAVNQLATLETTSPAAGANGALDGFGFALVAVSEACTACGTCARVCPTGALTFVGADSSFELTFTPQLCIGCEFCAHICAPQAITLNHQPTFEEIFGRDVDEIVQQGELSHCTRCKAPYATTTGAKLCPPCDFRRKNPFGSMIPPGARINSEKRNDPAVFRGDKT